MNILVIAYQISPHRGSEYSVAWNYVNRMSKDHNLYVICGTSGKHMGDLEDIDDFSQYFGPNVKFIGVNCSYFILMLNYLNKKGIFKYTFYLAYYFWHRLSYNISKELVEKYKIDVVHFVSPIGFRIPGHYYKLNIPSFWGPISGAEYVNLQFFTKLGYFTKLKVLFYNLVTYIQWNSSTIHMAINRYTKVYAATSMMSQKLSQKGVNSQFISENGIFKFVETKRDLSQFSIVWIGNSSPLKGFSLFIEVIKKLKDEDIHVIIIGPGMSRAEFDQKFNVDSKMRCTLYGQLSRSEVFEVLNSGVSVQVMTSMKEGNPTVVWEAMERGIPTVSFAVGGLVDSIGGMNNDCLISLEGGVEVAIDEMASVILRLARDQFYYSRVVSELFDKRSDFLWENRVAIFNKDYCESVKEITCKNYTS
jgi:glycosyltransferase involved in cell wall biosynthesis